MAFRENPFEDQVGRFVALAQAVVPARCTVQYDELAQPDSEDLRRVVVTNARSEPSKEFRLYKVDDGAQAKTFRFYSDDLWTADRVKIIPVAVPGDVLDALTEIRKGDPP